MKHDDNSISSFMPLPVIMTLTHSHTAFVLSTLLVHLLTARAQLVIVQAGPFAKASSKSEVELPPGKVKNFCPASYFPHGFSIDCRGRNLVPPVSFSVDGKHIRNEITAPYSIGGDINMMRYPWSPSPATLGRIVTVTCASFKATPPVFHTAVVNFTCHATQTSTAVERGCVVIKAEDHLNRLSKGWTKETGGGVTYRKSDSFSGVDAAGTSTLIYTFSVPKTSTYALTLDMTTRGTMNHNDVYLQFMYRGGFRLWKLGSNKVGGQGFLRAYHHRKGREVEAFADHNDPHSFSTMAVLSPGHMYYLALGGRSSKVTVHRIFLFPCARTQCSWRNPYWWDMVRQCA